MAGTELASIVASYLRRHGFLKALSAFLRENGDASEETDIVDLETLYKLYASTQANGVPKVKDPKNVKSEDASITANGEKVFRGDAEKAQGILDLNGGIPSERMKKKKGAKENALIALPELDQTGKSVVEAKKSEKEEGKKKKKKGENKQCVEDALSKEKTAPPSHSTLKEIIVENNDIVDGALRTEEEPACSQKSSSKKKKKERKEQEGALLQANEASAFHETKPAEEAQVLSQNCDSSKKKRKKSKDSGMEEIEDEAVVKLASKGQSAENMRNYDAVKQSVHAVSPANGLDGSESSAKKKKPRKELSPQGADGLNKPSEHKLDITNTDNLDKIKHSGKKRNVKEDIAIERDFIQDVNNMSSSPEKLKEDEAITDADVQMDESTSAKTRKRKETPDEKTPSGALAFKRVEVDKVTFSDPRLKDNSYWAKDGAEEGYGAKAQEVLGLVRGRDFRHEKTKKKRGSYRGGLIGLESHSIKFENSDDD